jgi:hypothetical protein
MNEQLKPYLDGELDSVNQIEFEAILKTSPELQREAVDYRKISESLKTADSGVPYGKEGLMKKLAQPASESNRKLWRIAWIWSGSMACLVFTAMMWKPISTTRTRGAAEELSVSMNTTDTRDKAQSNLSAEVSNASEPAAAAAPMSESSSMADGIQDGALSKAVPKAEFKSSPESTKSSIEYRNEMPRDRATTTLSLDTPVGIYVERQGDIQVKVEDLSQTVDLTVGIAKSLDGFIVSSTLNKREDGGEANVILRVPTTNFSTAINKIQAAGEVIAMNNSSQDITSETVDSNTRMNYWAVEEQRLIETLNQAKPAKKWEIRQELSSVRANLEAQRAMVKSLRDRAKYSTITAKFISGDVPGKSNWARNTFKDAKSGLGSIGELLGTIGIYALVFIPIWLPFAIVAYVIKKRQIR